MIRIHREGYRIVLIASIILLLLISGGFLLPGWYSKIVLIPVIAVYILIVRFFRIPKRKIEQENGYVIAPADGKVVAIEEVFQDEYFHDKRKVISIFMSIYNVHINWFPVQGELSYYKYHPGKYLVARHPKSSVLNERTTVVIRQDKNEILTRQIAGYVARRIICYAKEGARVHQGSELGFIRFGSRLDLYLPLSSEILVKIGDKTTGGVSLISKLPE